ncbi:hypothetical protein EJ04DRAFT_512117 [Polyplosphaeria fusca]|uniref:Uncharacterized protein n=1 Tax=Polyplosphaeria fusca TaxID=682080 RepID=A0A9P4R0T0_9PLEO|nr:hypothetical protein EJ04DRAFT_512117 [Polyplosphaeria fusca]
MVRAEHSGLRAREKTLKLHMLRRAATYIHGRIGSSLLLSGRQGGVQRQSITSIQVKDRLEVAPQSGNASCSCREHAVAVAYGASAVLGCACAPRALHIISTFFQYSTNR